MCKSRGGGENIERKGKWETIINRYSKAMERGGEDLERKLKPRGRSTERDRLRGNGKPLAGQWRKLGEEDCESK